MVHFSEISEAFAPKFPFVWNQGFGPEVERQRHKPPSGGRSLKPKSDLFSPAIFVSDYLEYKKPETPHHVWSSGFGPSAETSVGVSECRGVGAWICRLVRALFALHFLLPSSKMTALLRAAAGEIPITRSSHPKRTYVWTRCGSDSC